MTASCRGVARLGSVVHVLKIGYKASAEQFGPRDLVEYAVLAEEVGLDSVWISDHFQPWRHEGGHAPQALPWLAAVGERTSRVLLGTSVLTPTFRYNPAVLAQAFATLGSLYPGRIALGVGSGEALNEHILGTYWPEAPERINRMFEAIDIIKALFRSGIEGKDVKYRGDFFQLESTRLWTMAEQAPEILVATAGPITARRTGEHADGIITVGAPLEKISGLFERFAVGARKAGRDPETMPKVLQLHLSWAQSDEEALANAMTEWPNGGMKFPKADIRSPHDFAQMAKLVRPEDFAGRLVISADPDIHRREIQRYADLGFDRIYLHNVGRNQREWIEVFGREVLPKIVR
ncbi:MAG: TIGR03557 family F420-dependent LLM class oxidoreductase [Promicromonosporaceae bacterium]|nr:TIGR03557 family F420-dependent LLM class oxidoreductase [Promicromonosporaceae bacterium]